MLVFSTQAEVESLLPDLMTKYGLTGDYLCKTRPTSNAGVYGLFRLSSFT